MSVSTNADASIFLRDLDGPEPLGLFVGVWICGHAWQLIEPVGLAVVAGKAITKGG